MPTFTQRILASADDAEQDVLTGVMDIAGSDLELHDADPSGADGYVGMRWTGVTIPQGATINSAKIQFHVDEATTSGNLTVTFRGEDIDSAPIFTTTVSDISDRTETTALVDWIVPVWPTVHEEGPDQLSAELKTIVQEIVDRAGWETENDMVIMIKAWPIQTSGRTAESFDTEPGGAAQLQITYNQPPTGLVVVMIG